MMDISDTLAPKSDQLDAVELLGGPRTFTIAGVTNGSAEQPINVALAEFPRPWRPGVSMRRVLAYCWGNDASQWVGRRVTLFCDETVRFGPDVTGGTRISHMSHIDGKQSIPLLVKRGKHSTYTVEPLPDFPTAEDWAAKIAASDSIVELRQWWQIATPSNRALIETRVKAIEADALGDDEAGA